MGIQLIFVVETNKICKSDWVYIKSTIDRFYTYNQAYTKISVVYMNGKTKYADKEKEIATLIKQYNSSAAQRESKVIYCFDCDEYDTKREDLEFLKKTQTYCEKRGYKFVWFCKDIERVYLGMKVSDSMKKKAAESFKVKKMIDNVNETSLTATEYRANASNLLKTLDEFEPSLKRKGR